MNMKAYFPHFYHYLSNHNSIKNLSIFEKEIEIISYLKENKHTITTFVDENFDLDHNDFIQYIKEKTDAIITPFILSAIDSIDLNLVKDLFNKELSKNSLYQTFNSVKVNLYLRKEFLYNFNTINSGYITFYTNKFFEDKNSYTLYLMRQENMLLDSSEIIKNYIKVLFIIKILIIKFCFEKNIELNTENILTTSKQISDEIRFFDETSARTIIESFFRNENLKNISPISTLMSIFYDRSKIPNLKKHNEEKGFLGYDESWFLTKQMGGKEYDSRILKELLEIARNNKW